MDVRKINNYFSSVFINTVCNDFIEQYKCSDTLQRNGCSISLATIEGLNRVFPSYKCNAFPLAFFP